MVSSNEVRTSFDMDDPFSLAIQHERHSLLCDVCEESELFVNIERLIRLMPEQQQYTDQYDQPPNHIRIVDSKHRGQ